MLPARQRIEPAIRSKFGESRRSGRSTFTLLGRSWRMSITRRPCWISRYQGSLGSRGGKYEQITFLGPRFVHDRRHSGDRTWVDRRPDSPRTCVFAAWPNRTPAAEWPLHRCAPGLRLEHSAVLADPARSALCVACPRSRCIPAALGVACDRPHDGHSGRERRLMGNPERVSTLYISVPSR